MKSLIMFVAVFAFCTGLYAESKTQTYPPVTKAPKVSVLRHIVMVKFKKSTREEKIAHIVNEFRALTKKIDAIKDFEHGVEVNDGARVDGCTHCFQVTFADEAGLKEYLPHPEHQNFVALFKPEIELLKVFDYMSQE